MGFFRLPAELRNRIYELTVVSPSELSVESAWIERKGLVAREYGTINRSQLIPPPITQTCKQIRNEALPIFFGQNNFVAYLDEIELWSVFLPFGPAGNVPYISQSNVRRTHERANAVGPMIRLENVRSWLEAIGKTEAKLVLKFCIKLPLAGPAGIPRKVSPRRENGMRAMLRLLGVKGKGIKSKRFQVESGVQINGQHWKDIALARRSHRYEYDTEDVGYEAMNL